VGKEVAMEKVKVVGEEKVGEMGNEVENEW